MLKATFRRTALLLALTVSAATSGITAHAQTVDPQPNAVTGGDPQPTGEPPKGKSQSVIDPDTLAVLIAMGLA